MSLARKFLDCRRPILPQAVDYLIDRYRVGDRLDLTGVIVVLPGSRAARRLLELLVDAAAHKRLRLTPGEIVTIGRLPEQLYAAKRPLANELTQRAAWAQALRQADPIDLRAVVPHPPAGTDTLSWLELGDLLSREHAELAADALNFQHVADDLQKLDLPDELRRWQALSRIQAAHLRLLDDCQLWDRQTARLVAIERKECRIDRDIVLLGTVDLNRTQRAMLDAVADRVTALIPALSDWNARFDAHGCLRAGDWQNTAFDLAPERIHLVESPLQQATCVANCLAAYAGRYRVDEITVGIPDENRELIAQIERQLADRGVPARWGPGKPVRESLPCRLLAAMSHYLRSDDRDAFAALVRHPDLSRWLDDQQVPSGWLAALDDYLSTRFPQAVAPPWLGDSADTQAVAAVHDRVTHLTHTFPTTARPLDSFVTPVRQLLLEVYGGQDFDTGQPERRHTWDALQALFATIDDLANTPAVLTPIVTAHEALALVLAGLGQQASPTLADRPSLELLGWLELPLDDAPALIVTSFNDGIVPKAVNADPFLPNGIRARLGLDDNNRRYARDAYALAVMHASRQQLDLIVGQRSTDGDPLAPSRLLLAGDDETVLQRVMRLFGAAAMPAAGERADVLSEPAAAGDATRVEAGLAVPTPAQIVSREPALADRPGVASPLSELRVTAFRAYLNCPYRFFLQHVLKLSSAGDESRELDPLAFGSLLHDVLRDFGRGECRNATDPRTIRDELREHLARLLAVRFGARPLPAVRVQLKQMQLRLDRFAELQAERARAGWEILCVESENQRLETLWDVDGQPLKLIGRIDRIDRHRTSGQHAVLDYKTAQSGDPPEKTHRRRGEWVDLQLPLYRHLAPQAGAVGPLQVGYILLPSDANRAGFALADWTEADYATADETARQVVRELRRRNYWPPNMDIDAQWDDFAAICQSGVLGARP